MMAFSPPTPRGPGRVIPFAPFAAAPAARLPVAANAPQPRGELYEPHLVLSVMASDLVDLYERDIDPSLPALVALGWPQETAALYFDAARRFAVCAVSERLQRRRARARILAETCAHLDAPIPLPPPDSPLRPAPEASPRIAAICVAVGAAIGLLLVIALEALLS